jgi:hypothetical protein
MSCQPCKKTKVQPKCNTINRLEVEQPCYMPEPQYYECPIPQALCDIPKEKPCDNPCDLPPVDKWVFENSIAGMDYNDQTQSKLMYQIPLAFINTKSLGRTGVCSNLNEGWRAVDPCTGYTHSEVNYCYVVRDENSTVIHRQDTRLPFEAISPISRCDTYSDCNDGVCPIGKVLTVVEGSECGNVGCGDKNNCQFALKDPVMTKVAVTDRDTGQVVDLPLVNTKVTIPVKDGLGVNLNIENDGTIIPRWKAKNTNTISHEFDNDGFVLSKVKLDPDTTNLTKETSNGLLTKLYTNPNDFTGNGTATTPLGVKINPDVCNLLKPTTDGLLVKPIFDSRYFSGCGANNDNPITLKNCPGFGTKFLTQEDNEYFSFRASVTGMVTNLAGGMSVTVGSVSLAPEVTAGNQGPVRSYVFQVDFNFTTPDTGCSGFDWLVQYNAQAMTNYQAKNEAVNYRAAINIINGGSVLTPSDQAIGSFWVNSAITNSTQNDFGAENTNASANKTGIMKLKSNTTISGNIRFRATFANGVETSSVVTSVSSDFVLLKKIKS